MIIRFLIIKLENDTHDYKVSTISKQVFKDNGNIVTLKIGENVRTVEDEAFLNCSKLQKVWLPSTMVSVGNKVNDFVQGTGLGLSICRDIAERMGANVYLDTSYMDGGSRFVFEVPVAPEEPEIPTNHNQ